MSSLKWDGVPNRTSQDIAELPDELDFEAFQDGVFINKIEHQQDSYCYARPFVGILLA